MIIKGVSAKAISDSRGEKTILVSIHTNVGEFSASSPSGKSTGKYEAKPYHKNIENDIKVIKQFSDYFSDELIEKFDDLRRIEDVVDRQIGANTLFAFESAILKALAKEKKKEIWQLININSKKFPRLVGNCIGGGMHSSSERKPDFQEFLLIPNEKSVEKSFEANKKTKAELKEILAKQDNKFKGEKNDEDAWKTSLNEKEILDILKRIKTDIGIDVASSTFYKRKNYNYNHPKFKRSSEEQFEYLSNLMKNFGIFYLEDPFEENDFESFAKLLKRFPDRLIVGDDLTTTNPERLKKAIKMKSISAIIVKPNQIGSLSKVKEVVEIAKKNNIKIVFSHRSGETEETILADLAFGFQADFFKCGITGSEREIKIKRLIAIEKNLK
ncbi:Enolase [uncultured archaeon]|nr:Enolase [uncultured archaeon]